jgi:hypothetical protein
MRTPNLREIVDCLRSQERLLKNVRFEAETREEERDSGSNAWRPMPLRWKGKAWYEAGPHGRMRVDVESHVVTWIDGAAPFGDDAFCAAWDGKESRSVHYRLGPLGKTFEVREGWISLSESGTCWGAWGYETGASFSAPLFHRSQNQSLADYLERALAVVGKRISIELCREQFEGVESLKIEFMGSHYKEMIWIDDQRGCALLGCIRTSVLANGRQWLIASDRVTTLVEAAPGLWFAAEAHHDQEMPKTQSARRIHWRASKVVANDPAFDETIFDLRFPAGWWVHDQIRKTRFRIGPDPENVQIPF